MSSTMHMHTQPLSIFGQNLTSVLGVASEPSCILGFLFGVLKGVALGLGEECPFITVAPLSLHYCSSSALMSWGRRRCSCHLNRFPGWGWLWRSLRAWWWRRWRRTLPTLACSLASTPAGSGFPTQRLLSSHSHATALATPASFPPNGGPLLQLMRWLHDGWQWSLPHYSFNWVKLFLKIIF